MTILLRGEKVIIDSDLAALYTVETRRLNEQVKRNRERFPDDFMFQLNKDETDLLMSQNAISSAAWGGTRKPPYAFTEHGALMAASVLNTERAVEMSVFIIQAFVRLRSVLASHRELAAKVDELERKLITHDRQIISLIDAIKALMFVPNAEKKPIGFRK